jgi:uncharacterized repeat protein (TIGR01451 family)
MKRSFLISLGAVALLASSSFTTQLPVIASLIPGTAIAQNPQVKRQVQLNLAAAKKIVQQTSDGKQQVSWQPLQGNVTVQPGDVIRYTVTGANQGDRPANNLVVTQPIPRQTAYILNSSNTINVTATVTYSIDNGKTFVAKPTVQVKLADGKVETRPAPAEAYTHVRWKFTNAIAAKSTASAAYQVRVK